MTTSPVYKGEKKGRKPLVRKDIVDSLLREYGVDGFTWYRFWGDYQAIIADEIEQARAFELNDAMKIKGVRGAEIAYGYVFVTLENSQKLKISLRFTKETITKIIKRKL